MPRGLILEPPYATRMMTFDWFSVFVCRWRPYSDVTCTDIFKGYLIEKDHLGDRSPEKDCC